MFLKSHQINNKIMNIILIICYNLPHHHIFDYIVQNRTGITRLIEDSKHIIIVLYDKIPPILSPYIIVWYFRCFASMSFECASEPKYPLILSDVNPESDD